MPAQAGVQQAADGSPAPGAGAAGEDAHLPGDVEQTEGATLGQGLRQARHRSVSSDSPPAVADELEGGPDVRWNAFIEQVELGLAQGGAGTEPLA